MSNVLEFDSFGGGLRWMAHGFGTRDGIPETATTAMLRQVHSSRAIAATQPGVAGEGDALITRTPGLALTVRTADCYPILLADARTRTIAAIHAGWRGTAERIVQNTIAEMGSRATDIFAAIGPGIGVCCYEVGEEVARRFGLDSRGKVDLARANREQLMESGVPASQIYSLARCTFCEPEFFYSYRRDGERAGRMISFILIRGSLPLLR